MAKLNVSKKAVLVIVAVAILGYLAGSGATYLALKDRINKNTEDSTQTINPDLAAKAQNALLETELPAGTISPTVIMTKVTEYNGKEVKVRGRVLDANNNNYFIVGQETTTPGSLKLDLSKAEGVDISKYVSVYSDPEKFKTPEGQNSPSVPGPATITGTVSLEPNGAALLTVTKIES